MVRVCSLNKEPTPCFNFVDIDDFVKITDRLFFSKIVAIEKTAWLFFFMRLEPLSDLFFYGQQLFGFEKETL